MTFEITSPYFFPGNISGSGMQHTDDGRVVNTRYGVNVEHAEACIIAHPHPDALTIACALSGPVEGTSDKVRALYLLRVETVMHIVTQMTSILARCNPDGTRQLLDRLRDSCPAPRTAPIVNIEADTPPTIEAPAAPPADAKRPAKRTAA